MGFRTHGVLHAVIETSFRAFVWSVGNMALLQAGGASNRDVRGTFAEWSFRCVVTWWQQRNSRLERVSGAVDDASYAGQIFFSSFSSGYVEIVARHIGSLHTFVYERARRGPKFP